MSAIYGVDLHPSFQAGISIPEIHTEGFDFVICKLSQGTSSSNYSGSIPWLNQARSLGMNVLGYHYLMNGNVDAQADVFCRQLKAAGVNGAIDAEQGSGDISNIRSFYNACVARGCKITLLYLPQWYWKQIGSPSLAGLPPLWSSRYPDMEVGTAQANYSRVPSSFWNGYGGLSVSLLQFSSAARVAGHTVDVNAYQGNKEQLAALFGATISTAAIQPGVFMALNDSEQKELLDLARVIDAQLRGNGAKGWPGFNGGTGESLTLVDYARRANVRIEDLSRAITKVSESHAASVPTSTDGSVSVEAITQAVTEAVMAVLSNLRISPAN